MNITTPCCRNDVEWSNNFVTCMLRQMLQQPDDTTNILLLVNTAGNAFACLIFPARLFYGWSESIL